MSQERRDNSSAEMGVLEDLPEIRELLKARPRKIAKNRTNRADALRNMTEAAKQREYTETNFEPASQINETATTNRSTETGGEQSSTQVVEMAEFQKQRLLEQQSRDSLANAPDSPIIEIPLEKAA